MIEKMLRVLEICLSKIIKFYSAMKRLFGLLTAMLLACFLAFAALAQAQKKPTKKNGAESMEDVMKQLQEEMGADPEMKKFMEESGMLDMLKQVEQTTKDAGMHGVDIAEMAATLDAKKILDKPSGLPILPAPVSKEQLKAYLQPLMQSTEAAIKADHKAEITQHLNKGKETGEIAMGYFVNREMDKALYLLLNACLTDAEDYVSLNNLGAFMTISGYAHKSLPILQYVQKQFPQTPPTLLNNLGQAWLSLGHIDKAGNFLNDALKADSTQSEAAFSLAAVANHQGNTAKCIDMLKQSIESGGGTPDAIGMLANLDPETNIAALIRPHYRRYYKKDHAITKRFRPPAVPDSYGQAMTAYEELETFFQNLNVTANEAQATLTEMDEAHQQQRMKIQQAQNRDLTEMMKTPGDIGALYRHNLKYNHPLQAHAHFVLAEMYNSNYSTSFVARMQREEEKLAESDRKLLVSLQGIQAARGALLKEASQLEGGENGEEELRLEDLFNQACALQQEYQTQLLAGRATFANLYVHNMEDLLNQKLQEEIFWLLVHGYPADPTTSVYRAYATYLSGIDGLKKVYPFVHELSPPCKEEFPRLTSISGKLQQWEADHCNVSWGFDVKVVKGRFDCSGMKMQVGIGAAGMEYAATQNPATWEITSHTISAEAGAKKQFELAPGTKAEVGATVGGSLSFDAGGNLTGGTVKASAGAGVSADVAPGVNANAGATVAGTLTFDADGHVTTETTGRVSADIGVGGSVTSESGIKADAGTNLGGSATIDGGGHVTTETTGKVSTGASISDPYGTNASLGSAEISLNGGYNTSGPSVKSLVNNFLK